LVEYILPHISILPKLKDVAYIHSKDIFKESYLTDSQLNRIYDKLLYDVTLRTIYEIFESDAVKAVNAIVFNGWVHYISPATGKEMNSCILSIHTTRQEFGEINLAHVDSKACFRNLKGVGSSKLHSLTPITPVLQMDKTDKRFIASYDVNGNLGESTNVAMMDWREFEQLVRQLFEKEFAAGGGEVKVTQSSRDGGVDAIIFDPDPIRGGKIVVQAKRYNNTVGVSAVRDLYGTVMNEGANKGILITTSDYGPDSYTFAKDKPLTLLNGAHLLHLLAKHGQKVRIELGEGRKLAN
jgi:restriction system protein